MKKLISCLLAVLLVCSVMSMNVFADRVVGNGPTPDINDGVGTFDPSEGLGGSNTDINVNFGQTTTKPEDTDGDGVPDTNTPVGGSADNIIVHKYAVDITYGEFLLDLNNFSLGENVKLPADVNGDGTIDADEEVTGPFYMVWDVNNYKYVLCAKIEEDNKIKYVPVDLTDADDKDVVVDEETDEETIGNGTADVLETGITLPNTVMVTNHSDLSVFTKLVLTNDHTDINWEITAAAAGEDEATATAGDNTANGKNDTATAFEEITKATAVTATATGTTPGKPTDGSTYYFTATPAVADGWLGVIGNLVNETATAVIGNITVTIAPNSLA